MPNFPAELFRMEGDPGAVRSSADAWAEFGSVATKAAGRVLGLDTSGFVGSEGDQFRTNLTAEIPPNLRGTGDAFAQASAALAGFAGTLTGLQDRMRPIAARAPALWAALEAARARTGPGGAAALAEAQRRWDQAVTEAGALRGELATAVDTAARAVDEAAEPGFGTGVAGASASGSAQARVAPGTVAHGSAPATSSVQSADVLRGISLVTGLLSFVPVLAPVTAPISVITGLGAAALDLDEYATTGEGDLTTIAVDAGLSVLPGVGALGRGVAGAVRPALRAPAALRPQAAAAGGRLFARPARALALDPIDVVSGEMLLRQTDVELPGLLPLVLERTHLSSYRVGGWYGRSWASTLDQRLEVDAEGVCFAAADGLLLSYPTPGAGPVLPVEGPRRPLTRTAEGYTVTDRGRTLHFGPSGGTTFPLAAVTDRNGYRIDVLRDATGAPTAVHHSGGYRIAVETRDSRITALRLRGGPGRADQQLVRYGYDRRGDLVEVVNSSGRPLCLRYDPVGRITRWEDRNGEWYAYGYDVAGRVVRTSGSGGCLAGTLAYDPGTGTTVATDSLGHATTYHANAAMQVERVVDPLGHTRTYTWDRYDRLLTETDPLGRTTHRSYDEAGDLVRVVRPDGTDTSAEYDRLRLPVRVVDPDGAVWRREHDAAGNVIAVTDPAGATTRYDHGPGGRLRAVTDALGQVRLVETDAAGLPVAVTDPLGAVTRWERDLFGRVVAVTDPLGNRTGLEWTVEGKLARRTGPDGATERWEWDGEGNLVEHVDAAGAATRFEPGHFDLPAARVDPDGARVEFDYDTELRLVNVTNPLGATWRYEYDPAGNLVGETDFAGRALAYRHDAAGQLVARTNGAGETVELRRDALGRVVERRCGDAVSVFEHDAAGRLTRARNADADLRVERDALGRVVAETCDGRTVRSEYDLLGRRVLRRTPAGAESRWEFDPVDRPAALHAAGHTVRFRHDAAGREVERSVDDDLLLTRAWDVTGRLDAETTAAGTRRYAYRADGFVTGVTDAREHRRFDLDPAGRVTAVHRPGHTERYAYDRAGAPVGSGRVRYEHDRQGRVVLRQQRRPSAKPRTWRYGWDADDHLVTVVGPDGARWRYRYDALGRRVAKQRLDAGGAVAEQVRFSWDGPVLAEQDAAGRSTRWDWEPGTFRPVTQVDEAFHAVVTDLAGTPTELVGPQGTVEWRAAATLWGGGSPAGCPLRFPGQYVDPESGLHYNLLRHYDPETARYVSADPVGLAGGPDPHGYVVNPLTWIDPFALAPCAPGGARFAVGGDGVAVDRVGGSDAVSLGRFPAYLDDARASGSRTFDIGEHWKDMVARTDRFGGDGPDSEVWYRNRAFLDQAVDRGSEIRLASDPYDPAHAGRFFEREIRHLQSRGYSISPDGTRMLPPGGS